MVAAAAAMGLLLCAQAMAARTAPRAVVATMHRAQRREPVHMATVDAESNIAGDEPVWQRTLTTISAYTSMPDPYRVAKRVLPAMMLHVLWSTFIVILHVATGFRLRAPSLLHTLLGGVLGLLLVRSFLGGGVGHCALSSRALCGSLPACAGLPYQPVL